MTAFYRFGPGDWLLYKWDPISLRIPPVRKVVTVLTREEIEDARNEEDEVVYEVQDMLTGECIRAGDHQLEGPFNEMEVLAHVRNLE